MQEYQQRVIEEKKQLDEKLLKLNTFCVGAIVKELELRERILLEMQSSAMQQYSDILDKRITNFK